MSFTVGDWDPQKVLLRSMVARRRVSRVLRNKFVAGLLIQIPIVLTEKALAWPFSFLARLGHHQEVSRRIRRRRGRGRLPEVRAGPAPRPDHPGLSDRQLRAHPQGRL